MFYTVTIFIYNLLCCYNFIDYILYTCLLLEPDHAACRMVVGNFSLSEVP